MRFLTKNYDYYDVPLEVGTAVAVRDHGFLPVREIVLLAKVTELPDPTVTPYIPVEVLQILEDSYTQRVVVGSVINVLSRRLDAREGQRRLAVTAPVPTS